MMKKRRSLLILPLILIPVITLLLFLPDPSNVFLNARNMGDAKFLKGNVLFAVIFAESEDSKWVGSGKETFILLQEREAEIIEAEAEKYGVSLDIEFASFTASVSEELDLFDNASWKREAIISSGLPEKDTIKYLKEQYNKDEAVIIFAVRGEGRSFAHSQTKINGLECAFVYTLDSAFRHEILHLFGAKDFYYPESVRSIAEEYFPDSVMLDSKNTSVDSFTAYLIGWCDEPDESAQAFIEKTDSITQKEINKATENETLTGVGKKIYENGTYEGELVDGIMQGEGVFCFNNGDKYVGSFKDGEFEGYGRYTYNDGGTYEGQFSMGMPFGQGTRIWPDGRKYTGGFVSGKMSGEGTLIMEDGTVYTGGFGLGYRTGKAEVIYPDGSTYKGDFLKNERHGEGVLTLSDGTTYSGEFKYDEKRGQGILTYPDGSTYTGEFDHDMFWGQGTLIKTDGTKYTGGFVRDLFQGQGTLTYPDGSVYTGGFLMGKKSGDGTLTKTDGTVLKGRFENDNFIG